jgi:hypothetical protein
LLKTIEKEKELHDLEIENHPVVGTVVSVTLPVA